jgi:hypothetical protein
VGGAEILYPHLQKGTRFFDKNSSSPSITRISGMVSLFLRDTPYTDILNREENIPWKNPG